MAALFVLLVMMAFMFLLMFIGDIWAWLKPKNEVKSVDQWDKFREFGEGNKSDLY